MPARALPSRERRSPDPRATSASRGEPFLAFGLGSLAELARLVAEVGWRG